MLDDLIRWAGLSGLEVTLILVGLLWVAGFLTIALIGLRGGGPRRLR